MVQQLAPEDAALHHEWGGEAHLKHHSISEISFFFFKIDALAESHLVAKEHNRFSKELVFLI